MCTRRLRGAAACLLLLVLAAPARGQGGPFVPSQGFYLGPNGGVQLANGQFTFDTDGSGFIGPGDHTHPVPAAVAGWTYYGLSPNRQFLLLARASSAACPGQGEVAVYRIPLQDGAPLVAVLQPRCLGAPWLAGNESFFDRAESGHAIATVLSRADAITGEQRILWVNLEGTEDAGFTSGVSGAIQQITYDVCGRAALVRHGVVAQGTLADYTLVGLVPGSLGVTLGTEPDLDQPVASATTVDGAPAREARLLWPDTLTVKRSWTIAACGTPPVTGACCLPGGGCLDGVTQSDCTGAGGTWSLAGSICATAGCPPPPAPDLHVALSGPATVTQGFDFSYTLAYSNTGTLASGSAVLTDVVPANCTYVSATGGPAWNALSRTLTWSLGALAVGASGQFTITVNAPCGGTSPIVNASYGLQGTPGGTATGPPVSTAAVAQASAPVTVRITTVPGEAPPVHEGAVLTHTIRLVNTGAFAQPGVQFIVNAGPQTSMGSVLQNGGGTATVLGNALSWNGSLPAADSVAVVFTTIVTNCRTSSFVRTMLQNGALVAVRNTCGVTLGSARADTIALAPPAVALDLRPLAPVQSAPTYTNWRRMALVRPLSTVDLVMSPRNTTSTPRPGVTTSLTLPAGLAPIADPPFVGAPPAGTTWDAASRTASWAGDLAPFDSVGIVLRVTIVSNACSIPLDAFGGSGPGCSGNLVGGLELLPVRSGAPWPGAVVVNHSGLRAVRADSSGSLALLCPTNEYLTGLARGAGTDLWVVGLPTIHFDPVTRSLETFGLDFIRSLGMTTVADVVRDGVDGSLVFAGQNGTAAIAIARWQPATGVVSPIPVTVSPAPTKVWHVLLDPSGRIVADGDRGLLRIDPASGAQAYLADPLLPGAVSSLCLDTDGSLVASAQVFGSGTRPLVQVDRTNDAFTALAPDLNALLPLASPFSGSVVTPNGDVWLGGESTPVCVVHRGSPPTAAIALGGVNAFDMLWAEGAGTGAVGEEPVAPAGVALALEAPLPNPFRHSARIGFTLSREAPLHVRVLDASGRLVRTLVDGARPAGRYVLAWDGHDERGRAVHAGVYFVQLEAGGRRLSRKVALLP